MQLKTKGIVLAQRNVSEQDKIITILTENYGLIEASARGVKNLKSNLISGTQLMCYANFCLFKNRERYYINSSEVIESFYNLRLDVEKVALASYFCQLLVHLKLNEENINEGIRLFLNSVYLLEKDKREKSFIKSVFELRAISLSGFTPNLVCCNICGIFEHEHMFLSANNGVLFCGDCINEKVLKTSYQISKTILSAMRHIIYSDFEKLFNFKISENSLENLAKVVEKYVLVHIDYKFNSLEFYKSILIERYV